MKTLIIITGLIIGLTALNIPLVSALEPAAQQSGTIKVAILDSGTNIAFKEGISLIDGSVKDYNGHGTLMAGIINDIIPEAELYIIKVIGKSGFAPNEEAVILGLKWAMSRDVDIINMSLKLNGSERLHQTIKEIHAKGIMVVAAAGNRKSGSDSVLSFNRQSMSNNMSKITEEITFPARYKEVISVGALDKRGRVYKWSIKGNDVDILCRGYKKGEKGTSIASAYAVGLAAKIMFENPEQDIKGIRNIIREMTESKNL